MIEWYLEMTLSCESAPVAKKMVTSSGGRMPVLTAKSVGVAVKKGVRDLSPIEEAQATR